MRYGCRSWGGRKLSPQDKQCILTSQWPFAFGPREVTMVISKLDRLERDPDPRKVAIGSRIRIMDTAHGDVSVLTLVKPRDAAPRDGRVSIYSPLGAHLLGAIEGETVQVPLLGSRYRFHVIDVIPPAESPAEHAEPPAPKRVAQSR